MCSDKIAPDIEGLCVVCDSPLGEDETGAHRECIANYDSKYKPCSRCGGDPYTCVCTTGWDSTRGMIW